MCKERSKLFLASSLNATVLVILGVLLGRWPEGTFYSPTWRLTVDPLITVSSSEMDKSKVSLPHVKTQMNRLLNQFIIVHSQSHFGKISVLSLASDSQLSQ